MIEHKWVIEEIDGGTIGVADFWKCSECGASGGFAWPAKDGSGWDEKKRSKPFYGNGSGLDLSDDCEVSKQLIAAFELGMECCKRWKRYKDK